MKMIFIIIACKSTQALQESVTKPIPCGAEEYSEQSIGLSIIDDKIYQFILVNETELQIIRYNYPVYIENCDNKLNLIDGELINGLGYLIPTIYANKLMKVINWNGEGSKKSKKEPKEPIIGIAMSINTKGEYHIVCLKSFDRYKYFIGDYKQNLNKIETYEKNFEKRHIMGTVSYQKQGIILFFYNKLSYYIEFRKLAEQINGGFDLFEWNKNLSVSVFKMFHVMTKQPESYELQHDFIDPFKKIFRRNSFTFGFVDSAKYPNVYLFSTNALAALGILSSFFDKNDEKSYYPYSLTSYENFFVCKTKNCQN